ncbi:MAG: hypothetical protein AMJ95_11410 [Omnitrophica WOR_2 bacterium SM23_72]|nr:MAG: hypothetical protein AMJ95_11410 [Omnitrophica WOR_2 bacterium SM23_72]
MLINEQEEKAKLKTTFEKRLSILYFGIPILCLIMGELLYVLNLSNKGVMHFVGMAVTALELGLSLIIFKVVFRTNFSKWTKKWQDSYIEKTFAKMFPDVTSDFKRASSPVGNLSYICDGINDNFFFAKYFWDYNLQQAQSDNMEEGSSPLNGQNKPDIIKGKMSRKDNSNSGELVGVDNPDLSSALLRLRERFLTRKQRRDEPILKKKLDPKVINYQHTLDLNLHYQLNQLNRDIYAHQRRVTNAQKALLKAKKEGREEEINLQYQRFIENKLTLFNYIEHLINFLEDFPRLIIEEIDFRNQVCLYMEEALERFLGIEKPANIPVGNTKLVAAMNRLVDNRRAIEKQLLPIRKLPKVIVTKEGIAVEEVAVKRGRYVRRDRIFVREIGFDRLREIEKAIRQADHIIERNSLEYEEYEGYNQKVLFALEGLEILSRAKAVLEKIEKEEIASHTLKEIKQLSILADELIVKIEEFNQAELERNLVRLNKKKDYYGLTKGIKSNIELTGRRLNEAPNRVKSAKAVLEVTRLELAQEGRKLVDEKYLASKIKRLITTLCHHLTLVAGDIRPEPKILLGKKATTRSLFRGVSMLQEGDYFKANGEFFQAYQTNIEQRLNDLLEINLYFQNLKDDILALCKKIEDSIALKLDKEKEIELIKGKIKGYWQAKRRTQEIDRAVNKLFLKLAELKTTEFTRLINHIRTYLFKEPKFIYSKKPKLIKERLAEIIEKGSYTQKEKGSLRILKQRLEEIERLIDERNQFLEDSGLVKVLNLHRKSTVLGLKRKLKARKDFVVRTKLSYENIGILSQALKKIRRIDYLVNKGFEKLGRFEKTSFTKLIVKVEDYLKKAPPVIGHTARLTQIRRRLKEHSQNKAAFTDEERVSLEEVAKSLKQIEEKIKARNKGLNELALNLPSDTEVLQIKGILDNKLREAQIELVSIKKEFRQIRAKIKKQTDLVYRRIDKMQKKKKFPFNSQTQGSSPLFASDTEGTSSPVGILAQSSELIAQRDTAASPLSLVRSSEFGVRREDLLRATSYELRAKYTAASPLVHSASPILYMSRRGFLKSMVALTITVGKHMLFPTNISLADDIDSYPVSLEYLHSLSKKEGIVYIQGFFEAVKENKVSRNKAECFLRQIFGNEDLLWMRKEAIKVLIKLDMVTSEELNKYIYSIADKELLIAIISASKEAKSKEVVLSLISWAKVETDMALKIEIAHALGEIKTQQAIVYLNTWSKEETDEWVRKEIILVLAAAGVEQAITYIINWAKAETDKFEKQKIAHALGEAATHPAVTYLINWVEVETDMALKAEIARALGETKTYRAVTYLINWANKERMDRWDKLLIAHALGEAATRPAVTCLINWAKVERDRLAKEKIARALGKAATRPAVTCLINWAKVETDMALKIEIAHALGEAATHPAVTYLINWAEAETDILARRAIAFSLAEAGTKQAVTYLIQWANKEGTERWDKIQIARALGKAATRPAVKYLIHWVKAETDECLRKEIARVLYDRVGYKIAEMIQKQILDSFAEEKENLSDILRYFVKETIDSYLRDFNLVVDDNITKGEEQINLYFKRLRERPFLLYIILSLSHEVTSHSFPVAYNYLKENIETLYGRFNILQYISEYAQDVFLVDFLFTMTIFGKLEECFSHTGYSPETLASLVLSAQIIKSLLEKPALFVKVIMHILSFKQKKLKDVFIDRIIYLAQGDIRFKVLISVIQKYNLLKEDSRFTPLIIDIPEIDPSWRGPQKKWIKDGVIETAIYWSTDKEGEKYHYSRFPQIFTGALFAQEHGSVAKNKFTSKQLRQLKNKKIVREDNRNEAYVLWLIPEPTKAMLKKQGFSEDDIKRIRAIWRESQYYKDFTGYKDICKDSQYSSKLKYSRYRQKQKELGADTVLVKEFPQTRITIAVYLFDSLRALHESPFSITIARGHAGELGINSYLGIQGGARLASYCRSINDGDTLIAVNEDSAIITVTGTGKAVETNPLLYYMLEYLATKNEWGTWRDVKEFIRPHISISIQKYNFPDDDISFIYSVILKKMKRNSHNLSSINGDLIADTLAGSPVKDNKYLRSIESGLNQSDTIFAQKDTKNSYRNGSSPVRWRKAKILAAMLDWDSFISLLRKDWQPVKDKSYLDWIERSCISSSPITEQLIQNNFMRLSQDCFLGDKRFFGQKIPQSYHYDSYYTISAIFTYLQQRHSESTKDMKIKKQFTTLLKKNNIRNILEVGTPDGILLRQLLNITKKAGVNLYGLDLKADLAKQEELQNIGIVLKRGDARNLSDIKEFKEIKFDLIYCIEDNCRSIVKSMLEKLSENSNSAVFISNLGVNFLLLNKKDMEKLAKIIFWQEKTLRSSDWEEKDIIKFCILGKYSSSPVGEIAQSSELIAQRNTAASPLDRSGSPVSKRLIEPSRELVQLAHRIKEEKDIWERMRLRAEIVFRVLNLQNRIAFYPLLGADVLTLNEAAKRKVKIITIDLFTFIEFTTFLSRACEEFSIDVIEMVGEHRDSDDSIYFREYKNLVWISEPIENKGLMVLGNYLDKNSLPLECVILKYLSYSEEPQSVLSEQITITNIITKTIDLLSDNGYIILLNKDELALEGIYQYYLPLTELVFPEDFYEKVFNPKEKPAQKDFVVSYHYGIEIGIRTSSYCRIFKKEKNVGSSPLADERGAASPLSLVRSSEFGVRREDLLRATSYELRAKHTAASPLNCSSSPGYSYR